MNPKPNNRRRREPWHRNFGVIILAGFAFFTVEFFLKNYAITNLAKDGWQATSMLKFTFVPNLNGAFSLPIHQLVIIGLGIVILLGLIHYFTVCARDGLYGHIWALTFIIWGAFSNLYDRIARGYVVDYIDIAFWPVFNLSDLAILVGFISLIVLIARHERRQAYFLSEA